MFTTKIKSAVIAILAIFIFSSALLMSKETLTLKIETETVQCGMCKKTIEKALKNVDGVISSDVNVKKKVTTVKYDSTETNPDEIKKTISKAGYATDDVKASKRAYKKLHKCCKLPEDR
jgi:periplasmic mercuric ion binding protein